MSRIWDSIFRRAPATGGVEALRDRVLRFRELVESNNRVLELMADAGEKLGGEYIFDRQYMIDLAADLERLTRNVAYNLNRITNNRYPETLDAVNAISAEVRAILDSRVIASRGLPVLSLDELDEGFVGAAGEKMARLGEVKRRLGLRVPDGFVVSAGVCADILERAGVPQRVEQALALTAADAAARSAAAREIARMVRQARLPRHVQRALRKATSALRKRCQMESLAVRSSAIGEDGQLSFAGQYRSLLGVEPSQLPAAYQEVLASLFSERVVEYRRANNLPPLQGLMAVGCMCMVDARSSGVLYTLDPADPDRDVMLVSAAWGLGKQVVEGSAPVDSFEISRTPPHEVLRRSIARKQWCWSPRSGETARPTAVPEAQQQAPAITDRELASLAAAARRIERYMKCAQDIEWAIDQQGRVTVLQLRPVRLIAAGGRSRDMSAVKGKYPVLMSDAGAIACRGIAAGPVHFLRGSDTGATVPDSAVLVARTSSPQLAKALPRASAVVTDLGTAASHLAAIAREYRVPAILGTGDATKRLPAGTMVTVDAEDRVVYRGKVDELLDFQLRLSSSYEDSAEFIMLRRMLKRITPLSLRDPQSAGFTAKNCRTYHDVIRFAHEKAAAEIAHGSRAHPLRSSAHVRHLELAVPLDLVLVDLGGGLVEGVRSTHVDAQSVASAPLRALLDGLCADGVWATEPAEMDLEGLMASITRPVALTGPLAATPSLNLAIISAEYLNLSLRLGYHFNVVDCYLSQAGNENYIYFRFAGGVTEMERRSRRARLLKQILERFDFAVEGEGDLVIGRIKRVPSDAMVQQLQMIGKLIGFTRQLDVDLRDDGLIEDRVNEFMEMQVMRDVDRTASTGGEMNDPVSVLVLDDEEIVCEQLKNHLQKLDFTVETFTESDRALARLEQQGFDVVITDLKMKGPTGLDVLHSVRRQGQGTQVILITGYATIEATREAEYGGVFEFVTKPFQLDAVAKMARKAAKKARRQRKRSEAQ